jgi:chromosome segregation ATPase
VSEKQGVDRGRCDARFELIEADSASFRDTVMSNMSGMESNVTAVASTTSDLSTQLSQFDEKIQVHQTAARVTEEEQEAKHATHTESVEGLRGSIQELRSAIAVVAEKDEVTEAMENWLDGRMAAVDRLQAIQQLEEQAGEVDATLGLLQRKIGTADSEIKTVRAELTELAESTDQKNTKLMMQVVKASTASVSKTVCEQFDCLTLLPLGPVLLTPVLADSCAFRATVGF